MPADTPAGPHLSVEARWGRSGDHSVGVAVPVVLFFFGRLLND